MKNHHTKKKVPVYIGRDIPHQCCCKFLLLPTMQWWNGEIEDQQHICLQIWSVGCQHPRNSAVIGLVSIHQGRQPWMPPCCASKGRKESGGTDATHSEESQWNLKKQGPLYPNELLMVLNLNFLPNHKWIHQDFVWIMILKKRGFMNPKVLIRLVLRLVLIG